MNHRRLTLQQLVHQYSLGGKRRILNLSYSTKILPNPPRDPREGLSGNQEPLFSWKPLYTSDHPSIPSTSCKMVWIIIILDCRVLYRESIIIIWIELCIPVIRNISAIQFTPIYILCCVSFNVLHSRIVSDPLLLPLSSINALREEDASMSDSLQWYDKTTNSFVPQQTKMTVVMRRMNKE